MEMSSKEVTPTKPAVGNVAEESKESLEKEVEQQSVGDEPDNEDQHTAAEFTKSAATVEELEENINAGIASVVHSA